MKLRLAVAIALDFTRIMANCYRCGRPILDTRYHLRRRVKTGGYERRRYLRGRMDTVQTHFGMRVVCTKCAHAIDRRELRLRFEGQLQIIIALLVMVIVLLAAR